MTTPSRVSPGVPAGGQFAATHHHEPDIELVTSQPAAAPALSAADTRRRSELLRHDADTLAQQSRSSDDVSQREYFAGYSEVTRAAAADLDPSPQAPPRPLTQAAAYEHLNDSLRTALAAHHQSAPEVASADKSAAQWRALGVRNGAADLSAVFAHPTATQMSPQGDAVYYAVADGIDDLDTLRGVATGHIFRNDQFDWIDPSDPDI